jgi:hypothetical protein
LRRPSAGEALGFAYQAFNAEGVAAPTLRMPLRQGRSLQVQIFPQRGASDKCFGSKPSARMIPK